MKRAEIPGNVVAEQSMLGALLRDEQQFWSVHDRVQSNYFTVEIHARIYQSIAELLMAGRKLAFKTLESMLPEEDESGRNVLAYLTTLAHNAQELNAADFADEIAEIAGRRRLAKIGEEMVKAAKSGLKPSIDIAAESEQQVLDVMQATSPRRPTPLRTVVKQVVSGAFKAREQEIMPGLTTGLGVLDEILGLVMPADLIFVLGAQGDGKSSLMAQVAAHISQFGPVGYFQNEMTDEQFAVRQIAANSGLSIRKIREGAFDFHGLDQIRSAEAVLQSSQIHLLQDPKMTVRQIRGHGLAMKRSIGLKALFIDQLTHIRSDNRHRNKFDRGEEVTSDLKSLALELAVPVFCAVQRTRRAQRGDDSTPQIDDADFPSVERDGDAVVAVWQHANWLRRNKPNQKASGEEWDSYYAKLNAHKGKAKIITLKVRSNEPFQERELKWVGETTTFSEL